MRMLMMDRSSTAPGMAVFEDGAEKCRKIWEGEPTRSPAWMEEVSLTLSAAGVSPDSIDRFICGLGPGSFSGIRACLSALTGMALPGGKPVYGVASAAGIALSAGNKPGLVTVVGDARRSRLWLVTYRVDPAAMTVRMPDGSLPKQTSDDFLLTSAETLKDVVPAGTTIVSADWLRLAQLLQATFPPERLVTHPVQPEIGDLGRMALATPDACRFEPLPIYLQPAVAPKKDVPCK